MGNPYLERVMARMRADGALERLPRHWAFRCERCVHRVGYELDCAGWHALSRVWVRATDSLVVWLGRMQARHIVRKYF